MAWLTERKLCTGGLIILALAGALCPWMNRVSTEPLLDPDGCKNTPGFCVDKVECDDGQKPCEARIAHSLRLHLQSPLGLKEDISKLVLFLNGVALTGVNPLPTGDPGQFRFYLRWEPGADTAWKTLLREPQLFDKNKPMVPVSMGVENAVPYGTAVKVRLGYYDRLWFSIWWVSVVVTFGLILHFRYALKVPITIASGSADQFGQASGVVWKYSLARVQLAFWFFLILSGYLFVCWMTGAINLLNTGLVGMLGVSGATAIGSAVTDGTSGPQVRRPNHNMLTPHDRWKSFRAFFYDILSDQDGGDSNNVQIYRLQNALWTLFLGITFVRTVWNTLALPEFDGNLVLLSGVSSFTYLGMKSTSGPRKNE
jgi:hypothetical protein